MSAGAKVAARKRGLLISNCQSQPIGHILNLFCSDIHFENVGVHLVPPAARQDKFAELASVRNGHFDVVLAIPLSAEFGPFSSDRLAETFPQACRAFIPNFYFSGLHPDLTYMGALGGRVLGPLGDYHSKIAITAYLAGLPQREALRFFSGETYAALGYCNMLATSFAELEVRERSVTVPFSAELRMMIRERLCFFTVNHPTSFVLGPYCAKLSAWLEEQGIGRRSLWLCDPSALPNFLAQNAVFPVYPEIAEELGLQFAGNYSFKPQGNNAAGVNCLDLEAFVAEEYESFSRQGKESFLADPRLGALIPSMRAAIGI